MKLTPWDHLVLFVTGSLPKKTQVKVDKYEAQQLESLRVYLNDIRKHMTEDEAIVRAMRAEASKDLVKDKATSSTSKKKATSTKNKPSK
jgi:hypothetical protein